MTSTRAGARRVLAVALLAFAGGPVLAQDEVEDDALVAAWNPVDLAREARAVLEARCASCHNPDAEDRKAVNSWADALDAQTMIDEDIIEPDAAELSYLLELIDDGEMPPDDSDVGAVTEAERATLLAWIEAGAPALDVFVGQAPDSPPAAGAQGSEGPESPEDPPSVSAPPAAAHDGVAPAHTFEWTDLGVLHPVLVHFPIALLLAAVLAELLVACGARGLRTAARFCAWLGFFGALAAGATGWLLGEETVDRLLESHRWLGVASVISALLFALSLEGRTRGGGSRSLHVALALATAVLVSLAAHRGGAMIWGTDYFSDLTFLPAFLR